MTLPATMNALLLKHDGLSGTRTGPPSTASSPISTTARCQVPRPGPGEVLVKVRMASVNPSDLYFIKGEYGQPRVKGAAAGFEGVGDVVDGNGLYARYLKGKRVAFVGGDPRLGRLGGVHRSLGRHLRGCQAGDARRGCRGPCGQPGDRLDHVRHRSAIRLAKSFIFTAGFSQLGKLMAGLARDHGYSMIAVIRKQARQPILRASARPMC
jgi:NADPH:quinone reductase-like Zn-dependent oxidoreductase